MLATANDCENVEQTQVCADRLRVYRSDNVDIAAAAGDDFPFRRRSYRFRPSKVTGRPIEVGMQRLLRLARSASS